MVFFYVLQYKLHVFIPSFHWHNAKTTCSKEIQPTHLTLSLQVWDTLQICKRSYSTPLSVLYQPSKPLGFNTSPASTYAHYTDMDLPCSFKPSRRSSVSDTSTSVPQQSTPYLNLRHTASLSMVGKWERVENKNPPTSER